jgi:transcriptional regulator with XRE-family HTH domain
MAKPSYQTLAAYLDSGRETQEALAERAGVSQAHISRVASGGSCSLALAKTLSVLTGVPVDSFGGDSEAVA